MKIEPQGGPRASEGEPPPPFRAHAVLFTEDDLQTFVSQHGPYPQLLSVLTHPEWEELALVQVCAASPAARPARPQK